MRRASLIELTVQLRSVRLTAGDRADDRRIAPYSAVQFTAYEQFKKLLTAGGTRELNTPLRLSAGALAGICSVCSTYPLDLVRSRLSIATATIGKGKSSIYTQRDLSIVGMTLKVYREEGGLRGLYRGVAMTALVRRVRSRGADGAGRRAVRGHQLRGLRGAARLRNPAGRVATQYRPQTRLRACRRASPSSSSRAH